MDMTAKLKIWKTYIDRLFEDDRNKLLPPEKEIENGPEITTEEVEYALKNMKTGKTPGPDE